MYGSKQGIDPMSLQFLRRGLLIFIILVPWKEPVWYEDDWDLEYEAATGKALAESRKAKGERRSNVKL